ncbi:MAG: NADH-ubiquinone oxidoreductase-F iron-sulfur binding region domain-containing protein, partial [Methylocystaceae bacterium]
WYQGLGDPRYPGTKIFTLSGDVKERRAVEVTTDITLRELIYGWGGGIRHKHSFQAAQVGGTSGALVPERLLDTVANFESMAKAGLSLGTGAITVFDHTRNLPEVLLRICHFFEHESCGKCTPCREGTFRLTELWQLILEGKAPKDAEEELADLCWLLREGSLCGLGQVASGPLESYLNFFTSEVIKRLKGDKEGGLCLPFG